MKAQRRIFINIITGMNKMIKAVIFDLDGTLLNTLDDLADSVNHILSLHSMKNRTIDEIRSFIGNGIPTLIARSVKKNTEESELAVCVEEMQQYYRAHADIKTKPYDGINELLKILKDKNILTAVVTNKNEESAKILCDRKFGKVFTAVIGDNGIDRLKPAPDNVFRATDILGIGKEEILYVGDSDVDIETAKNSGLTSVGVAWGFRDADVLRECGANHIINSPEELLSLII